MSRTERFQSTMGMSEMEWVLDFWVDRAKEWGKPFSQTPIGTGSFDGETPHDRGRLEVGLVELAYNGWLCKDSRNPDRYSYNGEFFAGDNLRKRVQKVLDKEGVPW